MDLSNETLSKMDCKRIKYNAQYSDWYKYMSEDLKDKLLRYSETLERKGERIKNCLNFWEWDVYHKNKLMDLQKVNRCMNNRFCPNCRKFSLASAIHNLSKPFNKLLREGFYPYLVTLTIPNVTAEELRHSIEKMNKAFRKLFNAYNYPLNGTTRGFNGRYMEVSAALKVLEITYNPESNTYHPHFHCIFFSEDYDESIFQKDIPGEFSNKRGSYNFYSIMDLQLMRLWTIFYNSQRLTEENYAALNIQDLYLCDCREMDSSGIVEVLKYTFKDADIVSYEVFKTIEMALERKRIRQGYGLLFGLKLEEDAEGEKLSLDEFITETEDAEKLYTWEMNKLIKDYVDYRKVSRAKANINEVIEGVNNENI